MDTPPPRTEPTAPTDADIAAFKEQLGRPPRGLRTIAHRCPCGLPDVVETAPRLEDGTPFPTTYYLTCPRAASAIGTLEANGVMKEMTARLAEDAELADAYRAAHEDYLARRDAPSRSWSASPARAGCPTGSSACTCWWRTRWSRAPASTRSATRRWRCCPSGGARGRV